MKNILLMLVTHHKGCHNRGGKTLGRRKGSKNKSVASAAISDPYVYGALKILEQARLDYEDGIKYGADGKRRGDCVDDMWEQWLETKTSKDKEASDLTVACGIASYIAKDVK